MGPDTDFTSLLAELRAGDETAAAVFCRRYGPFLRVIARRALRGNRLRDVYDSTDFVQEVWAKFFALPPDQLNFASPDAMASLLALITHQRIADAARHNGAEITRTTPADPGREDGPLSPIPSPVEAAIAGETWERLLDCLPVSQRPLLRMLKDGYTHAEVAARVNSSTRSVDRVVARIREMNPEIDAVLRAVPVRAAAS